MHDYFGEGRHDPVEMATWEEEQAPGVCHSSLTYVLDGQFGVSSLLLPHRDLS